MEFRSLKKQYKANKDTIDSAIFEVIANTNFISGTQVSKLEEKLADYVGVKHCITCANGTDALTLALMAWNIGIGDAVFVPNFTFFSSGEVVSFSKATPIFVDVDYDTCNIDVNKLEIAIESVLMAGKLKPKAIIAVDLFGQPADYKSIRAIADKYELFILEDGAQSFGGQIGNRKACSYGDISTTSFFPMKPFGCFGDGGAVFTDDECLANLIRSYCVHGKGSMKYDNIRIGVNSRLDTIQAAVLLAKFDTFVNFELPRVNELANYYSKSLKSRLGNLVSLPLIKEGYFSSWAQYTIKVEEPFKRDELQDYLRKSGIPTFVYYPKPMDSQQAFAYLQGMVPTQKLEISHELCDRVLSLPISPYMEKSEIDEIVDAIKMFYDEGVK